VSVAGIIHTVVTWPKRPCTSVKDAAADLRQRAHGLGGSHAQQVLLTLTLMNAAARAGDHTLANHILNERRPAEASTPLTAYRQERIGAW
jgi:hypothetical protein